MAWLVDVLLPAQSSRRGEHARVRSELVARFGGLTAYVRAPAEGLWKADDDVTEREDVVVYEVLTDDIDRAWWRAYKRQLEVRFQQEVVLIRAQAVDLL